MAAPLRRPWLVHGPVAGEGRHIDASLPCDHEPLLLALLPAIPGSLGR